MEFARNYEEVHAQDRNSLLFGDCVMCENKKVPTSVFTVSLRECIINWMYSSMPTTPFL